MSTASASASASAAASETTSISDFDKVQATVTDRSNNTFDVREQLDLMIRLTQLSIGLDQFRTKIKKGVIDIWWLHDDGGKWHMHT